MVHTALEGNCFVLSANQFCRSKDYMFPLQGIKANSYKTVSSGGSVIVSPSGTILAGPNYQGESLISADLGMILAIVKLFICYLFIFIC